MSELTVQVRYNETDAQGRVYHSNYFVWYDMARTEYLREHGCSYKELEENGIYFVVAEASNKYLKSVEFDDVILIKTKLKDVKFVSVEFVYDVFNKRTMEKVSEGWTKLAVIDKNGKIIKIPVAVLEKIKI